MNTGRGLNSQEECFFDSQKTHAAKFRGTCCLCLQKIAEDTAPAQKVSGKTAFQRNSPIQQNLNKVSQFCPGSHETRTGLHTSETCWVSCLVTHQVPPPFRFPGPWGSLLPNRLLRKKGLQCSHTSQSGESQMLDHFREETQETPRWRAHETELRSSALQRSALETTYSASWCTIAFCRISTWLHFTPLRREFSLISSKLNCFPKQNHCLKTIPNRHPLRGSRSHFPLDNSLCTSVLFHIQLYRLYSPSETLQVDTNQSNLNCLIWKADGTNYLTVPQAPQGRRTR